MKDTEEHMEKDMGSEGKCYQDTKALSMKRPGRVISWELRDGRELVS